MKPFFLLSLLLLEVMAFGQADTTYYFGINGKVESVDGCYHKVVVDYKPGKRIHLKTYRFVKDKWENVGNEKWKQKTPLSYIVKHARDKSKQSIIRNYTQLEDGRYKFVETINSRIIRKGLSKQIVPLLLDGDVVEFYTEGQEKSVSSYGNNELLSNRNWTEDGIKYFDNLFYSVDRYPAYSEGNEVLNGHLLEMLNKNKVDFTTLNGQVKIGFVVFEDGQIGGFRVLKGINDAVNEIVVNSFRSLEGSWIPAQLDGVHVRYFQTYPINFIRDEFQLEFFDVYSGVAQFERR